MRPQSVVNAAHLIPTKVQLAVGRPTNDWESQRFQVHFADESGEVKLVLELTKAQVDQMPRMVSTFIQEVREEASWRDSMSDPGFRERVGLPPAAAPEEEPDDCLFGTSRGR
ncbi:hypothetical protein [Microvirga massiliensis]|uniref:hypothetical protein n=1 Tax=Microvirga massiliensis TaxID=1033741 RepID=UPI00062B3362|nr:hypothetical protein [Microvirga massiliensis]